MKGTMRVNTVGDQMENMLLSSTYKSVIARTYQKPVLNRSLIGYDMTMASELDDLFN
jgi:hypothetical protein